VGKGSPPKRGNKKPKIGHLGYCYSGGPVWERGGSANFGARKFCLIRDNSISRKALKPDVVTVSEGREKGNRKCKKTNGLGWRKGDTGTSDRFCLASSKNEKVKREGKKGNSPEFSTGTGFQIRRGGETDFRTGWGGGGENPESVESAANVAVTKSNILTKGHQRKRREGGGEQIPGVRCLSYHGRLGSSKKCPSK